MSNIINYLIILLIACAAQAQVWPDGAICGPRSAAPAAPAGQANFQVVGMQLKNDIWNDQRTRFDLGIGLGRSLGVSVSSSARDIKGYGAFQRGLGDSRLGMSFWPALSSHLSLGLNGYFIMPTGFRKQEHYFDGSDDTTLVLPAYSLRQSAGEFYSGAIWTISPAADLTAFAGYFSTSDRTEQAFRWGMGATIRPFGERYAAELDYTQSQTRIGHLPNTETVAAALAVNLFWGLSIVPGFSADLDEEPMYGGSLGLRFSTSMPALLASSSHSSTDVVVEPKRSGMLLVAAPLAGFNLVDAGELWQSLQSGVRNNFDMVMPLPSLDLPGLPFSDQSRDRFDASVRALAAAHTDAEWLLITHVEREDVSKELSKGFGGFSSKGNWAAECRLRFQLICLTTGHVYAPKTIEAKAVSRASSLMPILTGSEETVLSMTASRDLTFQAYREAGREISRELNHAE
jgi:hypothetical protein